MGPHDEGILGINDVALPFKHTIWEHNLDINIKFLSRAVMTTGGGIIDINTHGRKREFEKVK